mmetsp:Transcript_20438/g.17787  ORF Transcript_20438/g.17787 Transcript_20438/m.17787 type:complete len:115 (+) Transcript_20438:1178-1522(+)
MLKHEPVTRDKVEHTIPTFLMQNIQLYEGIVSMLYNHPCYLQKMIESPRVDSNMVVGWITKIYTSSMDDERSINLLISLCMMTLEKELETMELEISSLKQNSNFVIFYNLILML